MLTAPSFNCTSSPDPQLLTTAAPLFTWEEAEKQAQRSPMVRFKAGAAIYDPSSGRIVSTGCNHPDVSLSRVNNSIHAEHHALRRLHGDYSTLWIIIVTVGRRGGQAYTSRPCYSCACRLEAAGIDKIIYAERIDHDEWTVKTEDPEELLLRAPRPKGIFARQQRIPA